MLAHRINALEKEFIFQINENKRKEEDVKI